MCPEPANRSPATRKGGKIRELYSVQSMLISAWPGQWGIRVNTVIDFFISRERGELESWEGEPILLDKSFKVIFQTFKMKKKNLTLIHKKVCNNIIFYRSRLTFFKVRIRLKQKIY